MVANLSDSVYFLELFSGNGSVSSTIKRTTGLNTITIDLDERQNPDIIMDLTEWDDAAAEEVKQLAGEGRPIIWASPPCTGTVRG